MNEFDQLYRAPEAPRSRAALPDSHGSLKWYYAGLAGSGVAAVLLGEAFSKILAGFGWLLILGSGIVGLAWLHDVWRWAQRHRRGFGIEEISPGWAIGRFFIPLYGTYWFFRAHAILADALNGELREHELHVMSEPGWAYGASACLVLERILEGMHVTTPAVLVLGFSVALWGMYMSRVDTFRRMITLAEQVQSEPATEG
ncbi:MAG TPA: hypothetical protein VGI39_36445 [Polyangiaceae bacterium]|jgi:hypothetical protein